MELVIRPEDKENVYKKFVLRFAQNEKFYTELSFRPDESVLKIDRKFSGTERALVHQRRCLVNGDANELKLRVILDRFSAEIFINDGEQVMSVVIFTEQEAKGISFFAEGAAKIDIVKYNLVQDKNYIEIEDDILKLSVPKKAPKVVEEKDGYIAIEG